MTILEQKFNVGFSFDAISFDGSRQYTGNLTSIIKRIEADGYDAAEVLNSADFRVSMRLTKLSVSQSVDSGDPVAYKKLTSTLTGAVGADRVARLKLLESIGPTLDRSTLVAYTTVVASFAASDAVATCQRISGDVLDSIDACGMSPLAWAVIHGKISTVEYALSVGYSIAGKNGYSWNYLDLATKNRKVEMAKFLTDKGAPPAGQLVQDMKAYGLKFR